MLALSLTRCILCECVCVPVPSFLNMYMKSFCGSKCFKKCNAVASSLVVSSNTENYEERGREKVQVCSNIFLRLSCSVCICSANRIWLDTQFIERFYYQVNFSLWFVEAKHQSTLIFYERFSNKWLSVLSIPFSFPSFDFTYATSSKHYTNHMKRNQRKGEPERQRKKEKKAMEKEPRSKGIWIVFSSSFFHSAFFLHLGLFHLISSQNA